MKKTAFLFLSLSYIFFIPLQSSQGYYEEKIYISPELVVLTDEGIFINLNGEFFSVDSISHDAKGIFIKQKEAWICPKCGRHRFVWQDPCPVCSTPKPKVKDE